MSAIAVQFDTLRSIAFGSISGTYAAIGGPTTHLMRLIKVINNTNADVTISTDAANATGNDFIPANSFALYDLETNAYTDYDFFLPLGTQFYVKTAGSPSSGSVYLTMIYGKGQ